MGSRERSFTGNTPDAVEYGSELSTYGFRFDACNNLTKLRCSVLGNTWETTYTYDNDNRPSTATLDSGKVITNTYDKLGRLQKKTIGLNTPYETTITYVDVGTNKTSGLIASYQNGNDDPYLYTYDDNGNITSVTHGSIVNTYVYDTANRLIRENNAELNQTITYAYDDWGNNTNESHYAYTTSDNLGTPIVSGNHQYTNSEWGDQQTGFNGEVITYDAMGNPLSYRNGFYNFTWRGRLLTGFTSGNYTYTFEYDEKGLRQKKTVVSPSGTNTTEYYYEGDVLIGMKRNSAKFLFSYDASGNVVSVNYNGTEYYYLRNAQGDIVKLIDGTGATVVEYTYRTRGRQISVTGSMASVLGSYQPFRWRGYVLDPEWGIYYLNSRYYDPNSSRFLSPDTYLSTGQGVIGYNAYAYCLDNPVRYKDSRGNVPEEIPETTPGPSTTLGPSSTPYPQPGPTPPSCPEIYIERPSGYTWFESLEEAVQAWADIYRTQSELYEHCTFIYTFYDRKEEKNYYTYGETGKGSLGIEFLSIRPNVVLPFIHGYFTNIVYCSKVAFVHTHPKPPEGYTCAAASDEDLFLLHLPGIEYVVVVPYENDSIDYYQ